MKSNYRESCDSTDCNETRAKKIKVDDSLINQYILDDKIRADLYEAFRSDKDFIHDGGIALHMYPFKHCILRNLVKDQDYLSDLKEQLLELDFKEKSNDLYKFQQSNDLKTSRKESISKLRKLLYKDYLHWMNNVTNIPLDENAIDMSCAKYTNTDVLLCHDDELEGRRIAYIFYLVPPWTKNDGGTLDLFTVDECGKPDKIVKSLIPEWNSLVFFEVTPVSFHQVSEVLSDKTRLSVSGWFHGPPIVRPSPFKELAADRQPPLSLKDETLISWVNPMYLQPDIVDDIRESFEENSEIELKDFLMEEKYEALLEEVKEEKIKWLEVGPANKRKYEKANEGSLTDLLKECVQLFKSQPMFKLLTTFTGLKLSDVDICQNTSEDVEEKQNEVNDESKEGTSAEHQEIHSDSKSSYSCHGNLCGWSHGCYTLIHDNDPDASEMALDALFFIGCDGWQEEFGGYTSYIAREEDEELLTMYPCSNSLALVYRDTDTLKFVKHINNRCKTQVTDGDAGASSGTRLDRYYNVMCTYFE